MLPCRNASATLWQQSRADGHNRRNKQEKEDSNWLHDGASHYRSGGQLKHHRERKASWPLFPAGKIMN
jgi:hypothetical protein